MLFVLILGRIECTGSAYQGDRQHLTSKLNKIPVELCIHLLPMHDELLALRFSFCWEGWCGVVLGFERGAFSLWGFKLVRASCRLKCRSFAVWHAWAAWLSLAVGSWHSLARLDTRCAGDGCWENAMSKSSKLECEKENECRAITQIEQE